VAGGVDAMKINRILLMISLLFLLGLGVEACAGDYPQHQNPCKNPEFGIAEEGFKNCKPEDAFARLQELAKQNDPKALYMVGRVYNLGGDDFGLPSIKQNYDLSMKYFVRSAKLGYAEAQDTISLYYWRFYHETRTKEAAYWACRAAVQNNPSAVAGVKLQIKIDDLKQTVAQYCAPILKAPPPESDSNQ
jgi:TPR repeat protein